MVGRVGRWLFVLVDVAVVAWITLRPSHLAHAFPRTYNVVPLRSIMRQLRGGGPTIHRAFELVGNLLMLAPLAAGLRVAWPRMRSSTIVVLCVGCSASIEVLQYVTWSRRSADVDDVLLNAAGAVLAIGLLRTLQAVRRTAEV